MIKKRAAIEITMILMGGGCVAKKRKEIESVIESDWIRDNSNFVSFWYTKMSQNFNLS